MGTNTVTHRIPVADEGAGLRVQQRPAAVEQLFDQIGTAAGELVQRPRRGARSPGLAELLRALFVTRAAQIRGQAFP